MGTPRSATNLWRHANFSKLWLASAVSRAGSEVTQVALPLAAVSLGASPMHMGLLRSAGFLADFLVGIGLIRTTEPPGPSEAAAGWIVSGL